MPPLGWWRFPISVALVVSVLEPGFQVRLAASSRGLSSVDAYVGTHLLIFNLLQLYIFRRYDFVSMYAFRPTYYLYWHIIWGYLRLQLFF